MGGASTYGDLILLHKFVPSTHEAWHKSDGSATTQKNMALFAQKKKTAATLGWRVVRKLIDDDHKLTNKNS
jgi:hypothetical protein